MECHCISRKEPSLVQSGHWGRVSGCQCVGISKLLDEKSPGVLEDKFGERVDKEHACSCIPTVFDSAVLVLSSG